jgi:hypothetical protein
MGKKQKQFQSGSEYLVKGPSGKTRRLKFFGRMKLNGREYLVFKPVRKARKRKDSK